MTATWVDHRTVTYRRVYGGAGGPALPVPNTLRQIRLDLETEAAADQAEQRYELGDLRLTVRRSDWTVAAELDVTLEWLDDVSQDGLEE